MKAPGPSLYVYGAGRVGLAVARLARRRGVEVVGLWNPRRPGPARAVLAEGLALEVAAEPPPRAADLWLVAVPDDVITSVAERLAAAAGSRAVAHPRAAAHCAGGLSADALAPLAGLGIPCAAWHPAMTFRGSADDADALAEAWVTIEGEATAVVEALAAALGLASARVAAGDKPRYHAALVLAANGRVALDAVARRLLVESGLEDAAARALLAPLVARTDANLQDAPDQALTGPVARGDARTVRAQVEALADRPALLALYRALGAVQLELVPPEVRDEGHAEVARLVGSG